MRNTLFIVLMVLVTSSCSVRTNVGGYLKSRAQNEVRSSVVHAYDKIEIFQYDFTYLGQVETNYCQNEKFGSLPPESRLQRVLKAKAQKMGGNGIVYESCKTYKYHNNCESYLSCEGSVYLINQ